MQRILLIGLIIILFPLQAFSEIVYYQKNFYSGARPEAMAGAFTALADDVNAIFYNPAGLSYLPKNQAQIGASPMPIDNDFIQSSNAIAFPTQFCAVGFSIRRFDMLPLDGGGGQHLFSQQELSLALGKEIFENFAVGIKLNRYDNVYPSEDQREYGSSGDIGILFKPWQFLSFGAMVESARSTNTQGVPTQVTGTSETIPTILHMGICFSWNRRLNITADTQKNMGLEKENFTNQYGIEYMLLSSLYIRAGLYNQNDEAHTSASTFGTSFIIGRNISLDFVRTAASLHGNNLSLADAYSLRWAF